MKNIHKNNVDERLSEAKMNLEVYTDLKIYFDEIANCSWHDEAYKQSAAALFDAILSKIDPIDF